MKTKVTSFMAHRGRKKLEIFPPKGNKPPYCLQSKNRILKLKSNDGEWKEGSQLDDLVVVYFQLIFDSSNMNDLCAFLEPLRGRVMDTMNDK